MIISFLALILAAVLTFVFLPLVAIYSGFPLFLLVAGYFIAAWVLLCWVGHAQSILIDHVKKHRHH